MNFFESIVIGFVQGVGEFLPISSSGHLVLFYDLFNISNNTVSLSVFLHIATLFSVIYFYRRELIQLIKHPLCKTNLLLVTATIPTVIIAIILKSIIKESFDTNFVIFGFLITAVALGVADYISENKPKSVSVSRSTSLDTYTLKNNTLVCNTCRYQQHNITELSISFKNALFIGFAQGIACFPGISRSGSTIATGLILKEDKKNITTFSFLLSIPIIIGSLIMTIFDLGESTVKINTFNLITSCLISFLMGIASIKFLNKLVKKQKLSYFSFYLIGLVFVILFIKFIF